jgi:hypothetical protein
MKQPTHQDVRNAVALAVVVTVIVMLALFDPSCQPRTDGPPARGSWAIAPR